MRRATYFVMALALALGFTQCKKEQPVTPQSESNGVMITLNVENGDSRHDVNTGTGEVDFENGDVIYVGDGSHYIGTLTRASEEFSGPINAPADGTEIYFYFVGGLTPSATPTAGTTTDFTVDISDQSSTLPVLSCNHVTYREGTRSYSCKLRNKCALVKYTFTDESRTVRVGGRYTQATINFANGAADDPANAAITPVGTTGFITLKSGGATEKYGIFLPQAAVEGTDAQMIMGYDGYTLNVPAIGHNDYTTINGDAAVTNNNVYLNYLTGNYTATNGKILTGTLAGDYKINVNADGATVTLKDATITGTNHEAYSWAGITCENNTTLVIEGTNNVTGFYEDYPGIHIASGKTLTIQGTGTLNASSNGGANGWGAGIGGSDLVDCGNIVINSGTINATGGENMAGIGGGYQKSCGSITINGGDVTATGGEMGAGIGGGTYGSCGSITINGGDVTATGGNKAAGIGTGRVIANNTITGGDINISGGTVVATGGIGGAGIGIGYAGGANGDFTGGDINITGGTVVATGGIGAAGIGSGFVFYEYTTSSTCGNISITGGEVTATGGDGGENTSNSFGVNSHFSQPFYGGAGIGTGSSIYTNYEGASNCGTITIGNGVTRVTATKGGGTRPATNSIGKTVGYHGRSNCGTITIGGIVYWDGSAYQNGGDTYLPTSPLVYPAPTPAEATVTWINSQIQTIILGNGEGEIYQGIGVQLEDDLGESYWYGTDIYLKEMAMLTFQIDSEGDYALYDIKKIEICYSSFSGNLPDGGGWSNDGSKLTWDDGLNCSVILQHEGPEPDHMSITVTQIVFTLEKSAK